ncbi:MAG: hypothetical protein K0S29_790 [Gammaproteobacteria bacterium]|jgi:hypothetical protein|nr:hypothetical protein [Gammaproteobacteria bacterium]
MPRSIPQDNKRSRKFVRQDIKKSRQSSFNSKTAFAIAGLGLARQVAADLESRPRLLTPGDGSDEVAVDSYQSCFQDATKQSIYCLAVGKYTNFFDFGDYAKSAYSLFKYSIESLNTTSNICQSMIGETVQGENCQTLNTWQEPPGYVFARAGLQICQINGTVFSRNQNLEECIAKQFNVTVIPKIHTYYQGYNGGYSFGERVGAARGAIVTVSSMVLLYMFVSWLAAKRDQNAGGYQRLNNNAPREPLVGIGVGAGEEVNHVRRRRGSSVSIGSGPAL